MMQGMTTWTPFQSVERLRREMDELFNRFFGDWERAETPGSSVRTGYAPHLESYVENNTLVVKVDLPGVDPHDVELTIDHNQLTISGERKTQQEVKDGAYLSQEVRYGSFYRTVPLPEGVDAGQVQAQHRNGVLEVRIPLPERLVPKRIPVEGEERRQIVA
jgi:HSP20 family protein